MARHPADRSLSPIERQVALMHCANASQRDIGRLLDIDQVTVGNILQRTHVAKFVVLQMGMFASELKPAIDALDDAIQSYAARAFQVNTEVMEKLYATPEDHKHYVRALLGSAATAQDILDRAGKRAPSKVVHSFDIEPGALEQIASVLREDDSIDRAIDVTPEKNGTDG